MSERGSFVTEFIYCPQCFEAMKTVLAKDGKFLDGVQVKSRPIIAGKIGELYAGGEFVVMECELFNPDNAPCHPVRIAVLSDSGKDGIFTVMPDGEVIPKYIT